MPQQKTPIRRKKANCADDIFLKLRKNFKDLIQLKADPQKTQFDRNQNQQTGGIKYDEGKPRFDLIPVYPLFKLAEVYAAGAKKYGDHRWGEGIRITRLWRALLSHALKYIAGENDDAQLKTHHLAMVMWYCCAILEIEITHPELDDRNKNNAFAKMKKEYEKEIRNTEKE